MVCTKSRSAQVQEFWTSQPDTQLHIQISRLHAAIQTPPTEKLLAEEHRTVNQYLMLSYADN